MRRGTTKRYRRAYAGMLTAEELPQHERDSLVRQLVADGYTDRDIAWHTRMTEYTTIRIRERLGLQANQPRNEAA